MRIRLSLSEQADLNTDYSAGHAFFQSSASAASEEKAIPAGIPWHKPKTGAPRKAPAFYDLEMFRPLRRRIRSVWDDVRYNQMSDDRCSNILFR